LLIIFFFFFFFFIYFYFCSINLFLLLFNIIYLFDFKIIIKRIKEKDADQLKSEYIRLVEGLKEESINRETDEYMANPSK